MWVLNVSRFDEFWRVIFLGWRVVDQPPTQAQKLSLISRLTYTKKNSSSIATARSETGIHIHIKTTMYQESFLMVRNI